MWETIKLMAGNFKHLNSDAQALLILAGLFMLLFLVVMVCA